MTQSRTIVDYDTKTSRCYNLMFYLQYNNMNNNKGQIILTSDNFFDSIEFLRLASKEQVLYILFYVTEVAHLRKDMIPEIIADRIRDQFESYFQRNPGADRRNYTPISVAEVRNILERSKDWFYKNSSGVFSGSDRDPKTKNYPYSITESKKEQLWSKFDKDITSKISLQKQRLFIDKTLSSVICCLLFVLIAAFAYFNLIGSDDNDISVMSFKEYANRLNLDDYNTSKKSALFVYYVTDLTQMRERVNATAIHDRIIDAGYSMPTQEELNKILVGSDLFIRKDSIQNAFSLTPLGHDFAENVIDTHISSHDGIVLSTTQMITWVITLVSLLCTFIVWIFKTAYTLGKKQGV